MLWRQCPSTYEWINKTWYIHTIEYYAPIKKERSTATCYNLDELRKRAK